MPDNPLPDNPLMSVDEVQKVLLVKKTSAYKIINQLNKELESKGFLTVRGKVNRTYLAERYGIKENE